MPPFTEIIRIENPVDRFRASEDLVATRSTAIVGDSFLGKSDQDTTSLIEHAFSGNVLRIVVIGASCVGLAIANALKIALPNQLQILVLENRIASPHVKQSYRPDWLTMIPVDAFDKILDDRLRQIVDGMGIEGCMGIPIKHFETLLLLLNKSRGVKFLFDDFQTPLEQHFQNVDLAIDATGGRLAADEFVDSPLTGPTFVSRDAKRFGDGYRSFGITLPSHVGRMQVETVVVGTTIRPTRDGKAIRLPSLKIAHLPVAIYQKLIDIAREPSYRGRLYVWPGKLRDELNSILLIVNLHAVEYRHFASELRN